MDMIILLIYFLKEGLQSVLHISSAHNKGGGGIPNINIVQIAHFSNFFESKCWFIFIYEHSKAEQFKMFS